MGEYRELARSILSELVEINTTSSERGNNTTAARAIERRLLAEGFARADVQVLVPADAPTKGNLVARVGDMDDVRAHGRDERIGIQSFYEGQEFLYRLVKAVTGGGIT